MSEAAGDGVPGVEVREVSFAYGANLILDRVSLAVARGEFFAFLGPSGSGKTTLLRAIAGFGRPSAGRILVGGRDVTDAPPWARNVGMVFQNYALWPHMTVGQNVAFGLERRRLPGAEVRRRVEAVLALVGLEGFAARRPAQLSGGQQQRVALARTLVIEPEVLLLDEPLSNLDAKLRVEMRAELRALQRRLGLTTVYVTHDQEEANAITDRIAVLDGGRIQQTGAPLALYDRPANRFVAGFLGTTNLIAGVVQVADGATLFRAEGGIAVALPAGETPGLAMLMLRPQDVGLAAPSADGVPARVEASEFLGASVRYTLLAGPHRLVVDVPHHRGDVPLPAGATVTVAIAPGRASLLRD